jgi:hypothetical protein
MGYLTVLSEIEISQRQILGLWMINELKWEWKDLAFMKMPGTFPVFVYSG